MSLETPATLILSPAKPTADDATDTAAIARRNPAISLAGCQRILIIGRTGSGKTTLARQLAAALGVPHTELDALYFEPDFSTVSLDVLRERTHLAVAGEYWVTDGNKRAVRDLVWPRADTIVWLDYSLAVSLWRLGKRALWRTSILQKQAAVTGEKKGVIKKMFAAGKGVLTALRSHRGQRKEFPLLFARPENQHLVVLRLRSPRAARLWLARVSGPIPG
jgi:energy-coupling factor transporter ATP-binding protein EcfA2